MTRTELTRTEIPVKGPTAPPERVYLDHAASSPLRKEALEAMLPYLTAEFANASGAHSPARRARRALDDARDELGAVLGASGEDVVFTSGGTEADNLAILGVRRDPNSRVLMSAIEHPAVLRAGEHIGARKIAVLQNGQIDLDDLAKACSEEVVLVSVMLVNNEVGVIEPLEEVVALVRERAPLALVHCDAVQALGWCDVAAVTAGCDLISVSAHKFGGPKGIGALIVRPGARRLLSPVALGGPQERELRAGTENVAGAVAMAKAATLAEHERPETSARVRTLRDALVQGAISRCPGATETISSRHSVASIAHLGFAGIAAEELLIVLDELGIAASAGSACASGALEPSPVLLAMGYSPEQASQAVRFSLGRFTTAAEIERAIEAIATAHRRLCPDAAHLGRD